VAPREKALSCSPMRWGGLLCALCFAQRLATAKAPACAEATDTLCTRCPTPESARDALGQSALSQLNGLGIGGAPFLAAYMGRPAVPQLPSLAQCTAAYPQCGREEAACAVGYTTATGAPGECGATRFVGGAQPISVVAAVSVAADDADRFQSTVVSGPASPGLRMTTAAAAAGGVRAFNTSALDSAAHGFSTVVAAGRWVFYIPGCYSDHTTAAVFIDVDLNVQHLCTTLVRFDTRCESGQWEDTACFEKVNLRNLDRFFSFKNKINFGSAVYDGNRYLYLISGTGDAQRAPIAAFARLDIFGSLGASTSWRVVDGLERTVGRYAPR